MRTIIKNATIFKPNCSTEKLNILIEDNIIKELSSNEISVPAQEYDLSGYTLMPGFINTHVHIFDFFDGFNEDNLKKWLNAGFTYLRDQGVLSKHNAEDVVLWKNRINKIGVCSKISVCGNFISTPNGYGGTKPLGVSSEFEAREAVKKQIDQGVDHIKTTLDEGYDSYTASLDLLSENILYAICDESHKNKKKVSAHVNRADKLEILVNAGIDEAAHTCFDEISEELLDKMIRNNVHMTPTLSIYGEITANWGAPFIYTAMSNVKRFVDKGGIIGFGNDHIEKKEIWAPIGMPYMEIELLRKAGLTMEQILSSLTYGGAKILGNEKIGKIEKGCIADLVGVKGNPIEFPYLLTDIQFVMKDGMVVKNY